VFHSLDNPVWASLTGAHARFARGHGRVLAYQADVTPFAGFEAQPSPGDWQDLAEFGGPGTSLAVMAMPVTPPQGWHSQLIGTGLQMVADGLVSAGPATSSGDADLERLGPGDVPEMMDLVERTKPGPFLPRTIDLGLYLGIRRQGRLVAMAGERLRPPGWTEISAVCTDPSWRGHGFAGRLMLAVAEQIRARGETPFLHVVDTNLGAIRLYETLGFRTRSATRFTVVRTPAAA